MERATVLYWGWRRYHKGRNGRWYYDRCERNSSCIEYNTKIRWLRRDGIEWFPGAESSSIDHSVYASNNRLKQGYNGNDGIPRHFEILEIGLRVNNFIELDLLSCATYL